MQTRQSPDIGCRDFSGALHDRRLSGRSGRSFTRRLPAGRQVCAAIVVGVVVAAATACSSSSNGGSAADASNSKAPITILGMMDLTGTNGFYQTNLDAWKGAAASINAHGGINGHPLNLVICDSASNSSSSAACGEQAVTSHVSLVMDLSSFGTYVPYLQKAGIADISSGLNQQAVTSPIAFSFWAGTAAVAGPVTTAKSVGCRSVIFIQAGSSDPAETALFDGLIASIGKDVGINTYPEVTAPSGSADFSPFVAKAVSYHPGCIVVQGLGTDEVGLIRAVASSGTTAKLITISVYLPDSLVASLGSLISRVNAVATDTDEATDTSNPAVAAWVSQTKKYAPNPKGYQSAMAYAWSQVELAAYVLRHVANYKASTVLTYMNHLSCYNPGLLPPVNFTKPGKTSAGPRVFNPVLANSVYKNGAWHVSGKFYNIFTGKTESIGPSAPCPAS